MSETQDGKVIIEYAGKPLPARAFAKDSRVTQAAIADNKVLGPVLADIQRRQQDRDAHTLANKRLSLREEDLMRRNMGEDGLPGRRSYGRPTIPEKTLARLAGVEVAAPASNAIDRLLAQTLGRLDSLQGESDA